ncbi:hypothetical protein ATCC90586_004801 [Pythium insidiosum]|nr:hypothetical protein ATCC90586_004801 [Pythium insidiosum]
MSAALEPIDVDAIIEKLLSVRGARPGKQVNLTEGSDSISTPPSSHRATTAPPSESPPSSTRSATMIEDKKRKPSRDFPAHAQIPVGKAPHQTPPPSRLDMPVGMPELSLHGAPRSLSMLSTDSRLSLLSLDDQCDLAGADALRDSVSVPKHERPPQPANEREYFERLWSENFERSRAPVANTTAYIPAGAAGRLNRIKGFSFARDEATHRLYAVFRLEVECIVNEKQWTIYRRFHDFKQLAHQLKTQGMRVSPVPTRTLMRSLDPNFLKKRQLELDRWLREVLMIVSLENCRVDTERFEDCCGHKGYHMSCRIIRHFLTHSANEPPAFENVDAATANATTNGGRPPLHSAAETAKASRQSSSTTRSSMTATSTPQPPPELQDTDMRSSYSEDAEAHDRRRSVVVQDADADLEDDDEDALSSRRANGRSTSSVSLRDFDVLRMIGRGSFGKVLLVRKKNSSQLFAVKILNKAVVVHKQQVEHTRTERRVLASVNHPFVVCLHYAFQTKEKLFFVLDYCPGGDLFFHLSRCGCFPEAMAKFYAAEIVLALMHLHEQGIIYRDLKPENIMLDVDGHVKLADFGLAKEGIMSELDGTYTMCGTPEYLPPEILNRKGHGSAVDWWNLGMVLYEMLTGRPPWYTQDREELFTRLREAELEFPDGLSVEAMDLIQGLLTRDPALRLGARDPRELTFHPFFADIDWSLLYHRQVQPLYRPCQYTDPIDAANFEEEFTKLPLAEIDSDGLSIAADAAERLSGGSRQDAGAATNGAAAAGAHGAGSGGRNSALRNLSYTFAGFTYEGASIGGRTSLDEGSYR